MNVGIVVDGFGESHAPILDFASRANMPVCIVLNEKEKLANPMQQYTQVYFRFKGTNGWLDDDDLFNDDGFDGMAYAHWLSEGLTPEVGLYGGNEPYPTQRLINNTCDFMQGCIDLGRKAVLFNFAVTHPSLQWWDQLRAHERFNRLYNKRLFRIGGHQYYTGSIENGIQSGTLLQAEWLQAHLEYGVIFTEWGYLHNLDALDGWIGNISEDIYAHDLEVFMFNPLMPIVDIPTCIFMWNVWHGCEIKNAEIFKAKIIELNGAIEMYKLIGGNTGMRFHLRTGKGVSFPSLGIVNLDTMPVQILELSRDGYFKLYVPALGQTGWMYQSGGVYGTIGLRKV